MEYGGSGVTYNALPKFGGVPIRTREINETAPGRVFYSTVDNIGNLKIGDFFAVNQLTGEVSITAESFNLTGLNAIGPFRRNGAAVGVVLQEVSNNTTLVNAQGLYGEDTVPTQYAVKGYIDVISSSFDNRTDKLETTASIHEDRIDILEASQSAFDTAVVLDSTNVTILGNLTIQGTQTSIQSTILNVVDKNITLASGSIDSATANGAGINIDGADVTMSWSHVGQRIELNKDFAVTGLISSSTIVGIGNVNLYSTSVNSRLDGLELTGSNFDGRLDSIESYTASVSTSVGLLQIFSASQYINDSSSFDSRTDLLETTTSYLNTTFSTSVNSRLNLLEADSGSQESRIVALELTSQSLNQYTASVSTSVGLLQTFSASQYINDSSSFNTRISASTLTFNDTTGQTAIDFSNVGTQVSAIANGLSTGSNVQFNNITSSTNISASGTIYADTIVYNTLVGSGGPVLEYETVGTLGNILIKGATSKSIQVVDSITFTGLLQSGSNQYSASGLLMTGSITASLGFSGSIDGIGNVSEFSASIDSRIVNNQPIGYVTTSSFEAYTSSTNSRINAIESFTSSIDTTIKTKLNLDNVISGSTQITTLLPTGVVSGSSQVLITDLDGFANYNNSKIFDINQKLFSSSFNEYTQSTNTRLNSLEIKTGSYATTGSNIFFGTQTFTGSVYITQDLIVQGSSSLQNVTASAVSIGTNQINLNTDFPAFRYAGLNVYDSGSSGVSASLQWDSLNDQWIFLHQESGSAVVDSSILLYGPLSNDGLGSEATLTGNFLTKVENNGHGHHLTTSSIQDTGTLVTINSATQITGSLGVSSTQTLQSFTILSNVGQNLNFANDAAAAIGGVPLYGLYRNGNFIMIRLT
jgi:hypothetical protein